MADAFRARYLRADFPAVPVKLVYEQGYDEFFEQHGYVDRSSPMLSQHRCRIRNALNEYEKRWEKDQQRAFHIKVWRRGEAVEVVHVSEASIEAKSYFGRKFKSKVDNKITSIRGLDERAIKEGVSEDDYDDIKASQKMLDNFAAVVTAHTSVYNSGIEDLYKGPVLEARRKKATRRAARNIREDRRNIAEIDDYRDSRDRRPRYRSQRNGTD